MTARRQGFLTLDLRGAQSPAYRERGVARHTLELTKALVAGYADSLHQVWVDSRLPPLAEAEEMLASVQVTPEPEWIEGGILHLISPFELDIPIGELWPRAASRAGTRLVVTVHDLIPEVFPEMYLADPGLRRRYRARRELLRAADHVLAVSQSAAADAVSLLGLPEERVSVVGAAPGAAFVPPADRREALAEARRLLPGLAERYVVYNGAVEPRKNMEALVEAFAGLEDSVARDWQLVLACRLRPLERNHFEVKARQLGLGDRLLLTGYVPDETLVRLYQAAGLVAFPSLYEGYGLPVAEALACGAPVIASNTSSLVELVPEEATFDPQDLRAMRAALERALSDEAYLERLRRWALRSRPTWAEVAERAMAAYERLAREPAVGEPRPARRRWRSRPRVAIVTPWPPAATGVASYSRRLVEALSSRAEVDVYVDAAEGPEGHEPLAPRQLPRRDRAIGGYDLVLLCLGNSEHHAGALRLLRLEHLSAVVLAHDIRLTNLYRHGEARGAVPEGLAEALRALYPLLEGSVDDGPLTEERAAALGLLMFREVARLADRVLTTSEFAERLGRLDCEPGDRGKIGVWPYAYPEAVGREQAGVDTELVCSFGVLNSSKSFELLLEAFALLGERRPGARLAFVGPAGAAERERVDQRVASLGLGDRVLVTGLLPDSQYEGWLRRAGLAVQLRSYTNGEMSGAVADCLSHGVPTLVNCVGPSSELPGFVAKVPAGVDERGLAKAMEELLDDPARLARMSSEGLAYVGERGFERAAERLLELVGLDVR